MWHNRFVRVDSQRQPWINKQRMLAAAGVKRQFTGLTVMHIHMHNCINLCTPYALMHLSLRWLNEVASDEMVRHGRQSCGSSHPPSQGVIGVNHKVYKRSPAYCMNKDSWVGVNPRANQRRAGIWGFRRPMPGHIWNKIPGLTNKKQGHLLFPSPASKNNRIVSLNLSVVFKWVSPSSQLNHFLFALFLQILLSSGQDKNLFWRDQ